MRRFLCALLLCCFSSLFAATPSAQQLVPAGHWVYDAMNALAMETGETSFAVSAPLSIAELRLNLRSLPFEKLSESGKRTYDKVLDYFKRVYPAFEYGIVSLGADLTAAPEVRYKTNQSLAWTEHFNQRPKFIEIPLLFKVGDYAVLRTEISFSHNYWAAKNPQSFINIPIKPEEIDINFPHSSYLSAGAFTKDGDAFMNFHIGAGPLETGRTQTGSIIMSNTLLSPSYAQLSFFSTRLRYAMTPIQLNVDKYLYLHRFEARPFKRLSIALIEGVLISKPFELRFLNPAAIFHGMTSWLDYGSGDSDSAAYFGITFDVNPWKFMRIYGLFVMNQLQTSFETNNYESAQKIPNGMGGQGGIETWIPFREGYWYAGFEAVYTMPWLYISANKKWSFFRNSRFMFLSGKDEPSWVGYQYGPDVIAGQIKFGYSIFDKWSAFVTYRLKAQGENSFDSPYPTTIAQAQLVTPSGIPEIEHQIVLKGTINLFEWLTLNAHTAYVFAFNTNHVVGNTQHGFEIAFSVCFKLSDLLVGRIN